MIPDDVYVKKAVAGDDEAFGELIKRYRPKIYEVAITLLLFCNFAAISEEHPLSLGRYLAAQGNYDAAITEYKRFLFFHPDDARVGEVYYNIGLAYRAQGLWTEAITGLQTAMYLAGDSEAKSEYQLELAVTLIAAQDYDLARLGID